MKRILWPAVIAAGFVLIFAPTASATLADLDRSLTDMDASFHDVTVEVGILVDHDQNATGMPTQIAQIIVLQEDDENGAITDCGEPIVTAGETALEVQLMAGDMFGQKGSVYDPMRALVIDLEPQPVLVDQIHFREEQIA